MEIIISCGTHFNFDMMLRNQILNFDMALQNSFLRCLWKIVITRSGCAICPNWKLKDGSCEVVTRCSMRKDPADSKERSGPRNSDEKVKSGKNTVGIKKINIVWCDAAFLICILNITFIQYN